jgi:hypothetical protein
MNINRLNYENYFLLYVDGELSAAEMQAVEGFATENKDLAHELDTLLKTKLPFEAHYNFENKSTLLRTTSTHLNSINYEERFLLFVDKELTEQEAVETIDFVVKHPQYQEEFETLQQTKLPEEAFLFPFKDSLYRKEERKPVYVMQWRKIAVAAALIGIIVLIGILVPFNDQSGTVVKTQYNPAPTILNDKQNNVNETNLNVSPVFVQEKNTNTKKPNSLLGIKVETSQPVSAEYLIAKTEIPAQITEQEIIVLNTNNTIAPLNNHTIGIESNTHANQITAVSNRNQETEQTNYFKPAVYKELDTDDERKSLFVGTIEINKDKLRGFLRKASSLFKGKNKAEEEKTELSNSHTLE